MLTLKRFKFGDWIQILAELDELRPLAGDAPIGERADR
jgi:hypothetical protein